MIQSFYIKNYVFIEVLDICFLKGLIIIIGEIGVGKLIIFGVLGLIMGDWVDIKVFFNFEFKCVIEGWFWVGNYGLCFFFED